MSASPVSASTAAVAASASTGTIVETIPTEALPLIDQLRARVIELFRDRSKHEQKNAFFDRHWRLIAEEQAKKMKIDITKKDWYAPHGLTEITPDPYSLSTPDTWPAHTMHRFLRARKMKLEEAAMMFFQFLAWRDTYGVHDLSLAPSSPFKDIADTVLSHGEHGFDKHGRPIYIQKTGLTFAAEFAKLLSPEQVAISHTYFLERSIRRLQQSSEKHGKRIETVVLMLDVKGVGLGHRKTLKFFKATSFIDQNFYPEMLGNMYFFNCPSFFSVFWNIAKGFLDPVTQAKMRIMGTGCYDQIVEELGAENLPPEYGGCCNCQVAPEGCIPLSIMARQRRGSVIVSNEDIEEEEVKVKAGKVFELTLPVTGETDFNTEWQFSVQDNRDVDFTVEFRSTQEGQAGAAEKQVLEPVKRVKGQGQGKLTVSQQLGVGYVVLLFSNYFSYMTSKKVTYSAKISPVKPTTTATDDITTATQQLSLSA